MIGVCEYAGVDSAGVFICVLEGNRVTIAGDCEYIVGGSGDPGPALTVGAIGALVGRDIDAAGGNAVCSSARAKACILAKRSLGSFAKAICITVSISDGSAEL